MERRDLIKLRSILAILRQLDGQATPRPWALRLAQEVPPQWELVLQLPQVDGALICAMRNALPSLLAAIEWLAEHAELQVARC